MRYLLFWGHTPPASGELGPHVFSQWYPSEFEVDDELRTYLLGTGDRVLVEASPVDRIWGIGMARDDESAERPSEWRGLNLLGFALMRARAQLSGRGE